MGLNLCSQLRYCFCDGTPTLGPLCLMSMFILSALRPDSETIMIFPVFVQKLRSGGFGIPLLCVTKLEWRGLRFRNSSLFPPQILWNWTLTKGQCFVIRFSSFDKKASKSSGLFKNFPVWFFLEIHTQFVITFKIKLSYIKYIQLFLKYHCFTLLAEDKYKKG